MDRRQSSCWLQGQFGVSKRRACLVSGSVRLTHRCRSKQPDASSLREKVVLARYGHKATAKPVIDGNTNYHSAHTSS